ncbi:MAG TPA: hypothetical protein VFE62_09940 [Gemmataceae bacterium]|nr:hypothetical protein [Gemmataceae bacterium]
MVPIIFAVACFAGPASSADSIVDQKLMAAFGNDCAETGRPMRLWLPERNMVLSAGEFTIEKDGKVRLSRCSIAVFNEGSKQSGRVMTRIQSEWVILVSDGPVTHIHDLALRKIVGLEFSGIPAATGK